MKIDPDWVSAAANAVVALGLSLTWLQLRAARQEINADHERSRRERAVDYVATWTQVVDRRTNVARKLAERLSLDQSKAVFHQEAVEIDVKHRALLASIFDKLPEEAGGVFKLKVKESSELQWLILTFLNRLEVVLSAWRHDVADREILNEEFRFLVNPKDSEYILENFRRAIPGEYYPAIAEFVDALTPKNVKPTPRPSVLKRPPGSVRAQDDRGAPK